MSTHTLRHTELADLPGHDRPGGLPHSGENALVVRREHGLLHVRRAVRDQHHRPAAYLPRRRRGRGALVSKLFAHPLKDPFGDGQFIKLGPRHAGKIVTVVIEDTHFRILHGEDELAVRPRKNPGPITRLYVKGTGTQRDRQGSPDDKPSKKS